MVKKSLFVVIILINVIISSAYAEDMPPTSNSNDNSIVNPQKAKKLDSVNDRLKKNITEATPEKFQEGIKEKGNTLYESIKASTVMYIAVVIGAFLICMFVGIFFKKMIGYGFSVLALGTLGYFIINFAPDILELLTNGVTK
ncbi:hypothetical protein [Paenibacillus agricola]|uniref:TrbC/VIRB2 family protein n=1 Tax=Paenibacillus agricola TaxID=2716264 RepID=A0ABX0JFF8_9BACL|nr:hypothetical protein [Paenibacillus agricola]NHN34892.1 hypothetical protein [Paenibacillus agricola]